MEVRCHRDMTEVVIIPFYNHQLKYVILVDLVYTNITESTIERTFIHTRSINCQHEDKEDFFIILIGYHY